MFTRWGDLVYRLRFAVIGVVVAALLGLGGYGLGLEDHLSSSGWDDPTSESAEAAQIADSAYGRDHTSDVIVLYTAPEGKTIHDPEFRDKIVDNLNSLPRENPDQITQVNGAYWGTETGPAQPSVFGSKDQKHTFASIAIVGDNDTEMVHNYRDVKDTFFIEGVDVQVAGLQAVSGTLNDTMAEDQKRMELLAIPAVGVLLFFIFGGIVAAALPLIVGGLTVLGANGIIMILTNFTDVNSFVSGVVSMIGLGLAIDYGLFIVSRFREEVAEGYDTPTAVRRSVVTAGRTVIFSATMIIASLGGILLFPQGFLKSVAYGTIATVTLAALASITVLPAMLGILGRRVDALGLKRFRKTKSAEEVENSIWGRTTRWVMKHPLKIAIPITIGLLLLIIPVKNLAFGGINEQYLPPDNDTRVAQESFDEIFPLRQSDPIQLVFVSDDTTAIGKVWKEASEAPGLEGEFDVPSQSPEQSDVYRTSTTLVDSNNAGPTLDYLRSLDVPDDVEMLVGGQPAIQQDSIDALVERIPLMIALVVFTTTLLMFLTFGSLVLPIKAALMSALGLGSTLGILTWIFVDGHGASLLNFTPQPIMSPVLVLIIAIIYGLSTDYEVFLLSRMVEARSRGASTTEAVRIGTAHTGRIITAAALILLVVTGAFAFSDLVMMQYIAYGMIAALFIDATILRMLLVPATMKLLGDDCWWAPEWMKKVQRKVGLGEPMLDNEQLGKGDVVDLVKTTPVTDPVTMEMPQVPDNKHRKTPHRPRTVQEIEAEAPTAHFHAVRTKSATDQFGEHTATSSLPVDDPDVPMPTAPDPTRPRATPPTEDPGTTAWSSGHAIDEPAGPTGNETGPSWADAPTDVYRVPDDLRQAPEEADDERQEGATDNGREAEGIPGLPDAPAQPRPALGPQPQPGFTRAPDSGSPNRQDAPESQAAQPPVDPPGPGPDEPGAGAMGSDPTRPHVTPGFTSPEHTEPGPEDRAGGGNPGGSLRLQGGQPSAGGSVPQYPGPGSTPEATTDDSEAGPDNGAPGGQAENRPESNDPAPTPRPLLPRVSTPETTTTPFEAEHTERRSAAPEWFTPEPAQPPGPTAVPEPTRPAEPAQPDEDPASTDDPQSTAEQEDEPADTPPEQPAAEQDSRNSIEKWMAELRSSRRHGTPQADPRAPQSDDSRTVSVNEMLRRREQDD